MKSTIFLHLLIATAFHTAVAQTPPKKMNIQETITRAGVWESNAKASFHYREELYQMGIEETEADRIIQKTSDVWFMFRDNMLWHYGNTRFGQAIFAKFYFQVDEIESTIKMYQEATFEGEPVLTFDVKSLDKKRLIFFLEEEEMYFVCDYTDDKHQPHFHQP